MFFIGQTWSSWIRHSDDEILFLLCILCSLFLITPVSINLLQLQYEIRYKWTKNDVYTKLIVQPWLTTNIRFLYLLSIISGSAFSAIELCNSNLFQWPIFYMNLPRMNRQIFKNKRLYSIIIFENIPQLALQIIYSIIMTNKYNGYNYNVTFVTIFATIFSFLSILLTLCEFSTKNYLLNQERKLFVKFKIDSGTIQKYSRKNFIYKIEYKRYRVSNEIARILSIDFNYIELLKPIPCNQGAMLIFHIRTDVDLNISDNSSSSNININSNDNSLIGGSTNISSVASTSINLSNIGNIGNRSRLTIDSYNISGNNIENSQNSQNSQNTRTGDNDNSNGVANVELVLRLIQKEIDNHRLPAVK